MKFIENLIISIIILFLTLHLFTVHSKLLFHINPDKIVKELTYNFDISLFSQDLIVSSIGAIAYSFITALMLTVFVKYRKVFIFTVGGFAFLDAVGVFVYYNITLGEKLFIILGAVYYAIYTAAIIVALGLFRYLTYQENGALNTNTDNAIKELDIMELRDMMQLIFNENIQNIQDYSNKNDMYNGMVENMNEGVKSATEDLEIKDEEILHLSKVKHLTQIEIAEKLGISQPQVSRILAKFKPKNV